MRNYLLDGLSVLCEFSDSGEVLREYVPGVSVSIGGGVYFYHFDRLGSVRFLTDGSGNIVQEYSYDAWGNLVSSSGSISQPYQYLSYYSEVDIGLYLVGRRWYDPKVGRYISRNSFYALSSPYLFSNNNPVSSLPVYTPPISDITTPDNPKNSFQWMLPGSGVFFGWKRGIIYSQGSGIIFWCDNNCLFHRIKFKKDVGDYTVEFQAVEDCLHYLQKEGH